MAVLFFLSLSLERDGSTPPGLHVLQKGVKKISGY